MRLPNADHRKVMLEHAVGCSGLISSDVNRCTGVKPSRPQFPVALIHGHLIVGQREGRHPSPLWTLKGGRTVQDLPGLIHKSIDRKRLPAVGVSHSGIAGVRNHELIIERLVVHIGVVERFIGTVLKAKGNDLLRDVVAQCRGRTKLVVFRGNGRVVAQCSEQRIKTGLCRNDTR